MGKDGSMRERGRWYVLNHDVKSQWSGLRFLFAKLDMIKNVASGVVQTDVLGYGILMHSRSEHGNVPV
jgi:hypothetical protein